MEESSLQDEETLTYEELVEKLGTKGCYQWTIYTLVFLFWTFNGMMSLSISFLFMNPGFDCTTLNVSPMDC